MTLEAIVRRQAPAGPAESIRQTISRTADRIHVDTHDQREWLFERNVRDPRRASGFLIDHASRTIISYEESDLRNVLGLRGWATILMLGVDPELFNASESSRQARTIGGIRFMRYLPKRGETQKVQEMWWSPDQMLPAAFSVSDGVASTRF